jgi:YVTN family beta-propeller protein
MSGSHTRTYVVGAAPLYLALDATHHRVFSANSTDSSVSLINTITHAVTRIPVGASPLGIAINRDGSRLFVADNDAFQSLTIIDTATRAVITRIPLNETYEPYAVAVSPDDFHVTVGYRNAGVLKVVNTRTRSVEQSLSGAASPASLKYQSDGSHIFGVSMGIDAISRWTVSPAETYVAPARLANTGSQESISLWFASGFVIAGAGAVCSVWIRKRRTSS